MLYEGPPTTHPLASPNFRPFTSSAPGWQHASSTGRKLRPRAARLQLRAARLETHACTTQLQPGIGRGIVARQKAGVY